MRRASSSSSIVGLDSSFGVLSPCDICRLVARLAVGDALDSSSASVVTSVVDRRTRSESAWRASCSKSGDVHRLFIDFSCTFYVFFHDFSLTFHCFSSFSSLSGPCSSLHLLVSPNPRTSSLACTSTLLLTGFNGPCSVQPKRH